jgi:hypothetical protein
VKRAEPVIKEEEQDEILNVSNENLSLIKEDEDMVQYPHQSKEELEEEARQI